MRSKPKRNLPQLQLHLQLQLELCIPCNSLVICVSLLAVAEPEKTRVEQRRAELFSAVGVLPEIFCAASFGTGIFSPLASPPLPALLVVLFVLFVTSDADVILLKEHTNKPKK